MAGMLVALLEEHDWNILHLSKQLLTIVKQYVHLHTTNGEHSIIRMNIFTIPIFPPIFVFLFIVTRMNLVEER